ncbi:putative methyltransferase C9orf114 isoform X1 [Salvia splendens]|uniref:putative methyltransferase C9orf114 isoform X1 n=1 Tax=Salvia splendens TaxID=180675 RepID=UPI001C276201|nr:putative methyltransferase C9orf114 isoform X1 [Salvia splendens]
MGKKMKTERAEKNTEALQNGGLESNEKRSKKKRKNVGEVEEQPSPTETPTITVALPGSIINNTQSLELATRLAGQVARAAAIFRIDEVVVFDSKNTSEDISIDIIGDDSGENDSGAAFLMRILRYLETPQYLRKSLFPMHSSLRVVGLLPPLDAPHHLRKHEWATYREVYTNDSLVWCKVWEYDALHLISEISGIAREKLEQGSAGTLVDVGLSKNIKVDQVLEPGTRVTVEMGTDRNVDAAPRKIVPSSRPRDEGMYWGYKVRYAPNISSVFKNCPYQGGYDHRIGTSEHGLVINSSELTLPSFKHLLIAFGGLAGLEECVEEDATLKGKTVRDIFDSYLNTCPHQGSRTIRTEEAILISLQYFQEPINRVSQKYQQRTQ